MGGSFERDVVRFSIAFLTLSALALAIRRPQGPVQLTQAYFSGLANLGKVINN